MQKKSEKLSSRGSNQSRGLSATGLGSHHSPFHRGEKFIFTLVLFAQLFKNKVQAPGMRWTTDRERRTTLQPTDRLRHAESESTRIFLWNFRCCLQELLF